MGRGGKASSKRDFKKRVRSKDKDSDDSDEDYVVSAEENVVSEDELEDYCSSLDGDALEEGFDGFTEEEEVEVEVEVKEEEEVEVEVEVEEEKEEEEEVRNIVSSKAKKRILGNGIIGDKTSKKRKRVSYGEDEDYEEEEDEDEDEEFTPAEYEDEDEDEDEEEELVITKKKNSNIKKKKNLGRKYLWMKGATRGQKKRKSTVSKKPLGKKGRRNRQLRRKERCDDDDECDFIDNIPVAREHSKKSSGQRKKKLVVPSDSDFVSSGSSDFDYTISEEERDQGREANKLYGLLKTTLRRSSCSKSIEENGNIKQRRKPVVRKGKEKIEEVKNGGGKQVCGICLSEEDKRRLRGTLNCCSHYFCFTCIMEWSKVESRCPLCKQRFETIAKPERSTGGVDLRSVVIQVPKCDQVYQPTEEDLMSYFDPYENVFCSECHQGGDDGLMLLCDICDSPAHTYCVGLGQDVPDGNWYCYGCRPVALGSTSFQSQDPLPDQRTTSNNLYNRPSPIVSFGESLDPSLVHSPRIPLNQGVGNLSSPRFTVGDVQAASPGSGAGAPTLSGRRWIHRQIQNLLSISRTNLMASSADAMATANLSSDFLNSQIDQGRETVVQPARTQDVELSHQTVFEERLQENFPSSVENTEQFASRLNHLMRRQAVQDPTITTANGAVNLMLWPEHAMVNSIPPYEQPLQCSSISNTGSDGCVPPITAKDEADLYQAKEQLQSLVKSHLKNLSRDVELANSTFKDIARSATHTILVACGHEHRREVQVVHPPSICSHRERVAAGQTSLMKGFCSSCFDSFVKDIVKKIMDTRLPQWLSLGL